MSEAVDGLTWSRSKADLRLYRELFGMSVAELGRLAAVSGRTVRSWEDPRAWVPDRTAWMAVESLWRDADRMASGLAADAAAGPVTLPYGTGASTLACIASRIAAGRLSAAGVAWDASFPHAPGPDGGKARFRLMTDMLHAGGERGAALFGVSRQTVIAWRNPLLAGSVPAMEAWDALDARWKAMVGRASALADMMAGAAVRAGMDGRRPVAPPLTFYRLRSDWDAWGVCRNRCLCAISPVVWRMRCLIPSSVYRFAANSMPRCVRWPCFQVPETRCSTRFVPREWTCM